MNSVIRDAAARLDAWIEHEEFRGWDPFDALNSRLIKRLALGNRRLSQGWVQLFKGSPVNLRPILGIPKAYNPKSMGLFLASYWRKYLCSGNATELERTRFFLEWLADNATAGYSGVCWGYNFDWPNRSFFAPAGTPTVVNTGFNAVAVLDLISLPDLYGKIDWGSRPLELARSACEFVLRDLRSNRSAEDERCFSYTPLDCRCVHNANILGACLLAEVGSRTRERDLIQAALESARYTVRRQHRNGAWYYGEGKGDRWVDSFHTGYVLVGLKRISDRLKVNDFDSARARGYDFWKDNMFLADGTPKFLADSVYPIDTHSVAQGILTFLAFVDVDPQARDAAEQLAKWGIDHLQDAKGYFHFRINKLYRNRIPYMRWTQAWMQRSLAELLLNSR